jgi:hypothetical protein
MNECIENDLIPLDKSWIIRMGILDLIHGREDIHIFLSNQHDLSDDLLALKQVVKTWNTHKRINVGESGTLYRFLKYISWKDGLHKEFVVTGTLRGRKICSDSKIISMSQAELLKLDHETSQWASASALSGDEGRIASPPFKLKLTYEAIDYWNKQRQKGVTWAPRYDETILAQADAYIKILKNECINFLPKQAEDYCFAFVFGYVSEQEGERRWPSLRNHESDRIKEMTLMLDRAKQGGEVTSKDHRVVQAIAMWGQAKNFQIKIIYPDVVNKSWPQFWRFLACTKKIKRYSE